MDGRKRPDRDRGCPRPEGCAKILPFVELLRSHPPRRRAREADPEATRHRSRALADLSFLFLGETDEQTALEEIRDAVGRLPEVRAGKVARARKRIQDGFYDREDVREEIARRIHGTIADPPRSPRGPKRGE